MRKFLLMFVVFCIFGKIQAQRFTTLVSGVGQYQNQKSSQERSERFSQASGREAKLVNESGYRFLKSFHLDFLVEKEIEKSYVLSSGVDYFVKLNDCDVNLTILDENKKVVASNYVVSERRCVENVKIRSSRTGIYYFRFSLNQNNEDRSKVLVATIGYKGKSKGVEK